LAARVREIALPLETHEDLDALLERIGDAHYLLLGEASHGTAEYYNWRRRITQRLIREKGFSFIAVEGDWPDCYRVNRYVRGMADAGGSAREVLHAFARWPSWMWANVEVVELVEWLRRWNQDRPETQRVGFYGLDVYSLWGSMHAVLAYLDRVDGSAAIAARRAFKCFEPYHEDVQDYARSTVWVPDSCESEVVSMLAELRRRRRSYQHDGREEYFNAEQNALVAKNAERYYRTMVHGGSASWNVRDRHMVETLSRLIEHHGPQAKAIIWEHNTHIGDARATDMAAAGMVNVGQLVREQHQPADVVLVGFGSHRGTVIAGSEWEAPYEVMQVPPAEPGSWEDVFHHAGGRDALFVFDATNRGQLLDPRGHRAIGVVYHPYHERYGNYVPTVLPDRYDAFLYFDESEAVHPLHLPFRADGELPETFPSAV